VGERDNKQQLGGGLAHPLPVLSSPAAHDGKHRSTGLRLRCPGMVCGPGKEQTAPVTVTTPAWLCGCPLEIIEYNVWADCIARL